MNRLTAYVSGNVQKVGYRKRVIDIARAFGLKGIVENLDDGRVKIIAEGDDEKLKWFENAIEIKNTLIQVTCVEKIYAPAGGEFARFGKIVNDDETDSRLDKGIDVMNKILVAITDVNKTLVDMNSNLGGKMDNLSDKMDNLGGKMDKMDKNLGNKMDRMLQKQDELIIEVKDVGQSQNELLVEVKDINKKVDKVWEKDIVEMKNDISEVKAALRAKGII
ncbi:MAG: acylphosphatase [Methanothrix sp.]|nr:acylphosphatase [Methanothrix sp.]